MIDGSVATQFARSDTYIVCIAYRLILRINSLLCYAFIDSLIRNYKLFDV